MSEGKTRIPALEGTPEEIAEYKRAFQSDWTKPPVGAVMNLMTPEEVAANYAEEAADLQAKRWKCGARQRNIGPEVQDCDWPVCGCDPYASKVLDAIEESGLEIVKRSKT